MLGPPCVEDSQQLLPVDPKSRNGGQRDAVGDEHHNHHLRGEHKRLCCEGALLPEQTTQ